MNRKITGFHQDERLDWVADLECGHGQHVRHNPPWMVRPWVTTPEGRAQWLGAELECKRCDEERLMRDENVSDRIVLWRRLDDPGHDFVQLTAEGDAWHITGTALFLHEGTPYRLDYLVVCDARWRTVRGRVSGQAGNKPIDIHVEVDAEQRWRLNGKEFPEVAGCVDFDINFSPATNLISIRRLGLEIGEEAPVHAAWLRFPDFALAPLDQVYRRTDSGIYHYESGPYVEDLRVNAAGFITLYPEGWQAEPLE